MSNFETAIVKYLCPVCGKEADEAILINSIFTEKGAERVRKMHNKAIGFAEKVCKECAEYKDKALFLVGIDPEKSDNSSIEGMYRTGQILGIDKDSEIARNIIQSDCVIALEDSTMMCFVEEKLIDTLTRSEV